MSAMAAEMGAIPISNGAQYATALEGQVIRQRHANLLARSSRAAKAQLASAWDGIQRTARHNPATNYAKRVSRFVGKYLMAFADRMGKRGLLFTGLMILTSKTGQAVLGAMARAFTTTLRGVIRALVWVLQLPLRIIPGTRPAVDSLDNARDWLFDRCSDGWNAAPVQGTLAEFRHDGPFGLAVQTVARPYVLIKMALWVPGAWKLLALLAVGPFCMPTQVQGPFGRWSKEVFSDLDKPKSQARSEMRPVHHTKEYAKGFRDRVKETWKAATKPTSKVRALKPEGHDSVEEITTKVTNFLVGAPKATRGQVNAAIRELTLADWLDIIDGPRRNAEAAMKSFSGTLGTLVGENTAPFDGKSTAEQIATAVRGQVNAAVEAAQPTPKTESTPEVHDITTLPKQQ